MVTALALWSFLTVNPPLQLDCARLKCKWISGNRTLNNAVAQAPSHSIWFVTLRPFRTSIQ